MKFLKRFYIQIGHTSSCIMKCTFIFYLTWKTSYAQLRGTPCVPFLSQNNSSWIIIFIKSKFNLPWRTLIQFESLWIRFWMCIGNDLTPRLPQPVEIFTASEESLLGLVVARFANPRWHRGSFSAVLCGELVNRLQAGQPQLFGPLMHFALVLGHRADFCDFGDFCAVGDLGRTALVGLIGGNLGFRAFTSHADVETAVACSKQIYNESDTERLIPDKDVWQKKRAKVGKKIG